MATSLAILLKILLYLFSLCQCINIRQGLFNSISSSLDIDDHERISDFYATSASTFKYRAQQKFKGIPIFGASMVFEQESMESTNSKPVFGKYFDQNTINKFIDDITVNITKEEALNIALQSLNETNFKLYGDTNTKLYIYHYENVPYLAYIVKFSYLSQNKMYQPMIIINAKNSQIIKSFDSRKNFINACAVGGNAKIGKVRYCGLNSFKINDNKRPILANHFVQIYSNQNKDISDKSSAFLMTCSLNATSKNYEVDAIKMNDAYCAGCDVFEFVNFLFDLFNDYLSTFPVKDEHIPLKVYVHVGQSSDISRYDDINGAVYFGDGDGLRYPLSVIDLVGHEIGHAFTAKGSDLVNYGQAGGIDNAFSDLIGEIGEYFYYGSNDWKVGANSFRADSAERYMDDPTVDGVSIDHFQDYNPSINAYYSSGIYSKAMYLLNTQYSWSMVQIFKVFATANQLYWTNDISFNDALCGLYEALSDEYGSNSTQMIAMSDGLTQSFDAVGLQCNRNQTTSNCGNNGNTYCIYKDITPSLTSQSSDTVQIALEANDDRLGVNATIFIKINENECRNPQISFEYETIDLDNDFEWIRVYDYEKKLISQCGDEWDCGTWDTQCIKDYNLGIDVIEINNLYTFEIFVPADVDSLCFDHNFVINARLIFKCNVPTPSPTLTQPTMSPITLSPTNPTLGPTVDTFAPTPMPTHVISECGEHKYCYFQDVAASKDNATETVVKIQNEDENDDVFYFISFNVSNYECIEPTLSFEYELIDYDLRSEYISILDANNKELARCNGGSTCNQWETCLYPMTIANKIGINEILNITVMESFAVDALCSTHDWSINARLKLKCLGGTSAPTLMPTIDPTMNPTVPTLQSPSFSPTKVTTNPSPSPTNNYACGRDKLCYDVDVFPLNVAGGSKWEVSVEQIDTNVDTYYEVFFHVHDGKCVNPALSLKYEPIDYDQSNEYLNVHFAINGGTTMMIKQCGNESVPYQCGIYRDCFSSFDLQMNAINDNETYNIEIYKPRTVDAQCIDHRLAINATITLECSDGTAHPTIDPTVEPSLTPTLQTLSPTPSPTYFKQKCGENYCFHIDIYPENGVQTEYKVVIQNANDSKETNFDIFITPYFNDCVSPSITFEFERIDYNAFNEYLTISGQSGFEYECGGDYKPNLCGFFDLCLNNTAIGINKIPKNDAYKFRITQSDQVEAECLPLSDLSMNAIFTITCQGQTSNPTLSPTPEPTQNPTNPTQQPTAFPSIMPTDSTNAPTMVPTHRIEACGSDNDRFCVYEDIYPKNDNKSSFVVNIQAPDTGDDIYYDVYFTPKVNECIHPSITFIFESIDYDQDYEHINVTDAKKNQLIAQCNGGAFNCGSFDVCLFNHSLDVQKIGINSSYVITLALSGEVDALCLNHDYSMNAVLTMSCNNDMIVSPTTAPTQEPTFNPTENTLMPSSDPTVSPTVVTMAPTATPTYQMTSCGVNTYCISADLNPDLDKETVTNVRLTHVDVNAAVKFNVVCSVVNNMECVDPKISFNYEMIDYDGPDEYINITNANGNELAKCGSVSYGQICGQFHDCFVDLSLTDTPKIGVSDSYTIGIYVTKDVDALCNDHNYIINAILSFTCSAGTTPPTYDPTTPQPTVPSAYPTTMPTLTPTLPSYAPTESPTWSVLCGTNTWCYHVNISPLMQKDTEFTVPVQYEPYSFDDAVFKIIFYVSGIAENDCVAPKISLIYETIDYDSYFEYMNVTDNNGKFIEECGANLPDAECNVFDTCLADYLLSDISAIRKDAEYTINIVQPSDVDPLCSSVNNPYSLNATLTLKCSAGTANPTPLPTNTPSQTPTIQTTAPTTAFPTIPSLAPTFSPTYLLEDCSANVLEQRYCIRVDLYPDVNAMTSQNVQLQDSFYSYERNKIFDVFFTPKGADCVNPSITFKFEKIDHDQTYEWINITNAKNKVISQCGAGQSGSNACGQYEVCVNDTDFGKNKILQNETYKLSVINSVDTDALCSHSWSMNAVLTIFCREGSAKPTISPTTEPTDIPTQVTANPTSVPSLFPTIPTVAPTLSPTFGRRKCGGFPIQKWCYFVDIYPNDNAMSEWIIPIQGEDDEQETHFIVDFYPISVDCVNPTITLKYENIDLDGSDEYLEVFDNNGQLLQRCGSVWSCNTFSYCLKNFELEEGKNNASSLSAGSNYTITIIEQDAVDGLCAYESGHTLSMNAELTLQCNNDQSTETNTNGTLCGNNKYCFEKRIYPKAIQQTVWEQAIYHYNDEIATEFVVEFIPVNERCYDPQIQFLYERIDYDASDEFIDIFGNDSYLISRCGAGKLDNECGAFDICLSDGYDLNLEYIEMSDTYKISLYESSRVDAMCSNHSYSINGILTMTCNERANVPTKDFMFSVSGSDTTHNMYHENVIVSAIDYAQVHDEQRFNVYYNVTNVECLDAKFTVTTTIKVNGEYEQRLIVYDAEMDRIGQCDSTSFEPICPYLMTCVNEYDLKNNSLQIGDTYQFSVYQILNVEAGKDWCDDGENSVRTELSLTCNGLPSFAPTKYPTTAPMIVVTTNEPTLVSSDYPTEMMQTESPSISVSKMITTDGGKGTDEEVGSVGNDNAIRKYLVPIIVVSVLVIVGCLIGMFLCRERKKRAKKNWDQLEMQDMVESPTGKNDGRYDETPLNPDGIDTLNVDDESDDELPEKKRKRKKGKKKKKKQKDGYDEWTTPKAQDNETNDLL